MWFVTLIQMRRLARQQGGHRLRKAARTPKPSIEALEKPDAVVHLHGGCPHGYWRRRITTLALGILLFCGAAAEAQFTIMPLGDSMTYGASFIPTDNVPGSYRRVPCFRGRRKTAGSFPDSAGPRKHAWQMESAPMLLPRVVRL
jgi:hypothetical protein